MEEGCNLRQLGISGVAIQIKISVLLSLSIYPQIAINELNNVFKRSSFSSVGRNLFRTV